MSKADSITAEQLREYFEYDQETGIFTRRIRTAQRHKKGSRADFLAASGYMRVAIGQIRIQAHRAAWVYVYGELPKGIIDHINGDRQDNRISNLRDVSQKLNMQNVRKAYSNSTSGFLGVYKTRDNRWMAKIQIGIFDNPEDAYAAYLDAKRKIHEGCTI